MHWKKFFLSFLYLLTFGSCPRELSLSVTSEKLSVSFVCEEIRGEMKMKS